MDIKKRSQQFMVAVMILGAVCVIAALVRMDFSRADIYLALLSVFTIALGSRITLQIPRFKSHISVSDTFVFLVLLMYGGEYAIVLAAIDAAVSAWKFCNRKITVFFNAATMAVATTTVVGVLDLAGLYTEATLNGHGEHFQRFVIALSLLVLVQFLVNTSLASIYSSLRAGIPLWDTWKTKYVWTFFSYFIGAISAGVLVQISDLLGMGMLLAIFPVILFVFLSYRMYLKNVQISMQQAEQAEQYARILESQSEALKDSEERFRSAFDHAPIGIGLVSASGNWLKANRALTEILGYSESELLTTDFQSITLPEDLGPTLVKIHELLNGKIASCQMEQRYIHKTGRIVWASWSGSSATDARARQPNLIFQIQDITDKKSAEEKLQHDATHDVLTGLPNRLFFMNRLADALRMASSHRNYRVSVLFIDLDRFKYVNDSLGHVLGDDLLKEIAARLRDCMRPSDIVARLGGDEFTILVEGSYDENEVNLIAERIQRKFGLPFDLRGHEVFSSASIGILHATEKHRTPEDVMRDADTAMYQAKRAGKARHEVFDEEMHRAAAETLRLETDLRRAVERDEISVAYQPIYSLANGEIECVEALARWDHPELGPIPPPKFIPLAEEIGVIDLVCDRVLRQACLDIGSLRDRDGFGPGLSVNLSCRQFGRTSLVSDIERILESTGFRPHDLKLEITESVFFEHHNRAIIMLNDLRSDGIEIYIDDFGTGYSNLGYLKKLPISALKIDRSFVGMIDEKGGSDEIVSAITTLARNLGLTVVAEGVETNSQLDVLRRLHCEYAQGFLMARPMAFVELKEFLDQGPQPPPVDHGSSAIQLANLVQ